MKRISSIAVLVGLTLAGLASAERLRPGEQAIFLKSGETIIGSIADLSSSRLVLQLKDGREIPLRGLWMINFVTDEWNFPRERNLIETPDHYIFLKNGDVTSGRIVDFSSEKREFAFESGDTFALPSIRRIYFSRSVPRGLR